jgi:hypothetical protein
MAVGRVPASFKKAVTIIGEVDILALHTRVVALFKLERRTQENIALRAVCGVGQSCNLAAIAFEVLETAAIH